MLDQIIPAIAAGRVLIWCEATPKGMARLLQIKPSLRGLFETVTIEPLSQAETLPLATTCSTRWRMRLISASTRNAPRSRWKQRANISEAPACQAPCC